MQFKTNSYFLHMEIVCILKLAKFHLMLANKNWPLLLVSENMKILLALYGSSAANACVLQKQCLHLATALLAS